MSKNNKYWYELAIDHGKNEGTETIETYKSFVVALNDLIKTNNKTAFIDIWGLDKKTGIPTPLDTIITKKQLSNTSKAVQNE